MNKKYEYPEYINLIQNKHFDKLTENYFQHNVSSDEYNKWISKENLIINKAIWFHKHKSYIHIYGENKIECEKFKELLKSEKIII